MRIAAFFVIVIYAESLADALGLVADGALTALLFKDAIILLASYAKFSSDMPLGLAFFLTELLNLPMTETSGSRIRRRTVGGYPTGHTVYAHLLHIVRPYTTWTAKTEYPKDTRYVLDNLSSLHYPSGSKDEAAHYGQLPL